MAIALGKAQRGWDCERAPGHRPRGVQPLPTGKSNVGDRRDMLPREASRPRRDRRRAGRRSLVEGLRPIDAFSFQSPSRSFRASRQRPLADRESGPRSERRIRHLGAMSPPAHEGRTQNEMPQSVSVSPMENPNPRSSETHPPQSRLTRTRAPIELTVPALQCPVEKERAAMMAITQNPPN